MSKRPTLEAFEQEHYISKESPVPKYAAVVPDAIVITYSTRVDGELILETTCRDYGHYESLPEVVSYSGEMCGLTGWNSDRGIACYKSRAKIAHKIGK